MSLYIYTQECIVKWIGKTYQLTFIKLVFFQEMMLSNIV